MNGHFRQFRKETLHRNPCPVKGCGERLRQLPVPRQGFLQPLHAGFIDLDAKGGRKLLFSTGSNSFPAG